ncbi:MAG: DUF2283 domain-containing protein [Magnetococcus sp. DMHC-8]
MKIRYFADTDTLYIQFRDSEIVESRDIDEGTLVELDGNGHLCAMTVEHARERAGWPSFSLEQVAA